jgi:glutamine amidotransferase-like uncharacterized protein
LALVLALLPDCRSQRGVPLTSSNVPPILLFNGNGTSAHDVAAVEDVLDDNHLVYSTADSAQLNAMSETRLEAYRLLIFPGGNFIEMGNALNARTTSSIRSAVQGGLSYMGICAGAFLAGSSPFYKNLNLTSGVHFEFYAAEARGQRKASVAIASPGTAPLDQYWEDGPELTGWGAVVGKYPDGTPAVVEGAFGSGFVLLSGVHAEAPESWRSGMVFKTPVNADRAYAAKLIFAALNRSWLAHY